MSETNGFVDIDAMLAALEKQREDIDTAISALRNLKAHQGGKGAANNTTSVPPNAFFTLGIVDATKKYLGMVHSKRTLPQIVDALHQGGMPPLKPNTVYSALRRRQGTVGDIINVGDEWGLKEWFSNVPVPKKTPPAKKQAKAPDTKAQRQGGATETKGVDQPSQKGAGLSLTDACAEVLRKAGKPLHITEIAARLPEYGRHPNARGLSGNLRQEAKQRFQNLGENWWALKEWPEDKKKKPSAI